MTILGGHPETLVKEEAIPSPLNTVSSTAEKVSQSIVGAFKGVRIFACMPLFMKSGVFLQFMLVQKLRHQGFFYFSFIALPFMYQDFLLLRL